MTIIKKILFFILISLSFSQFRDINISYEYNENLITNDKIYIFDEFTSKIEKYLRTSNFSYEFGTLDIPIKLHFVFESKVISPL